MNFIQFINIIWSRKQNIIIALMVTVITTLVVSLLMPKQYSATATIMINQRGVDPVTGQAIPIQLLPGLMATQMDIITSHNVALKVVNKLNLSDDLQTQKSFIKTKIVGDIKDWIADQLIKESLTIKPSRESSLIEINFTSPDQQYSAIAANAFVNSYIKTTIELRAQPAKLNSDWFDTQLSVLRDNLGRAQSLLSSYQQQHGIIATTIDHLDLESTRLSELSKQLVSAQAQTSELESRKNLLISTIQKGGSIESLQEVLENPLIQTLKSELAKAEARLAELYKRVDINHPQYKEAKAEVNSLQQKIQAEIKMVLNSIYSRVDSSMQRDVILANSMSEQKTKILKLKKQNDEIAVMSRVVENAQRAYDVAMQRAGQTRMESEMNQTDISILNWAIPPQKHATPKILLNILVSIFLGSLLGVGSAYLAELMDRRLRSILDLSEALAIPVFNIISEKPFKPKRIPLFF